jgi:hypothetical protein
MTQFRAPEVKDDFNGQVIAEFRANYGKAGGSFQGFDIPCCTIPGRGAVFAR